jgi:hypothetical protein
MQMDGILYTPPSPPPWRAEWALWTPPVPAPPEPEPDEVPTSPSVGPEGNVRALITSLFGAPERTDRFICEWFCNRSAALDLGARVRWFLDALLRSPIQFEVGTDRALRVFKCAHLTIHASELSDDERALLREMMQHDRWKLYFGGRGVLFTGNDSRVVQYRDFLFSHVVTGILDPVKLCARLFALLLTSALESGAVGQMRLVLEGVLIDYPAPRGAGWVKFALLREVLVDGLLLLIKRHETNGR